MRLFTFLVWRELRLGWSQKNDLLRAPLFFAMALLLYPIAVETDGRILNLLAPGLIWIMALLALLLSLDRLFSYDQQSGALESLLLLDIPRPFLVLAKVLGHWILSAGPLLVVAPIAGFFMALSEGQVARMMLSLLLGTPSLSLLGGMVCALSLGARRATLLVPLLLIPLSLPILIFGVQLIKGPEDVTVFSSLFLLALLFFLLPFSCFGASWALSLRE